MEYMLCGAAARLAQSKGLHRQPAAAWHLPQLELLHRNWTFWAVYCYDKYLALRSGRPPVSTFGFAALLHTSFYLRPQNYLILN